MQHVVATSEKQDKREEHGRWRMRLRMNLDAGDFDEAERDVWTSNWNWAKDGKGWLQPQYRWPGWDRK